MLPLIILPIPDATADEGANGESRIVCFGYRNHLVDSHQTPHDWAETLGRFRLGYQARIADRGFCHLTFENLTLLGGDWRNADSNKDLGLSARHPLQTGDRNQNVTLSQAVVGMRDCIFTGFTATCGRFDTLHYGRGRIIGTDNWNLYSQNRFDGFLGEYEFDSGWLSLMYFKLEETGKNTRSAGDIDLKGLYLHCDARDNMYFEPYIFSRSDSDDELKGQSLLVFGALWDCAFDHGLHLYAEGVWEYGYLDLLHQTQATSTELYAFAYYGGLNFVANHFDLEPSIGVEFNYASGTPYDETEQNKTFQQLWGSSQSDYLGRMNLIDWSNTLSLAMTGGFTPTPGFEVDLFFYRFFAAQQPAPGSSKTIGSEFDVRLDYSFEHKLSIEGGLGIFSLSQDYYQDEEGNAADAIWQVWLGTRLSFHQP